MSFRRFAITAGAAAFLTAGAWAQQTTSTTVTRSYTFPPAGLASPETAQLNVVNTASNSSSGTAASCTGSLSFLNPAGATIGTATAFTVTSGQVFSASLPFGRSGLTGSRGEVRGVVTLTTTSNVPCRLAVSFETFDTATGATHIYQSGDGLEGPDFRR